MPATFDVVAIVTSTGSITASVLPDPVGAEIRTFFRLITTGQAFFWMGVGLLIPAFSSRVRRASSAATVNTGHSGLLFLGGIMFIDEHSHDGRNQDHKGKGPCKREETSLGHLSYSITLDPFNY
jgi:hypothetical protein